MKRENVLHGGEAIISMFTHTSSTKEGSTSDNGAVYPTRKRSFFGRTQKMGLLFFLCAGLAILLVLHIIVTYIQHTPSAATTCAGLLNSADYTRVVGFQADNQQMAAIQMVDSLDNGSPAALVQVTGRNPQNTLAVYVFGCTLENKQPRLVQLFTQQGLAQGTVTLTPEHTLVTATLDTNLSPSTIPLLQPFQQNVYHEYAWRKDRFVQVLFPGFYPVASRVEAQALQQSFNSGQKLPWNDPLVTARQMAKDLLKWSSLPQARLISQTNDTTLVELVSQNPPMTVEVTLHRIIQPASKGLWFVTDARTRGMILSRAGTINEPLQQAVTSPFHFSGANALIDGKTTATLFDHTLTPLKRATNVLLNVQPNSTYTGTLSYSGLIKGQQGVLLVESLPQDNNQDKEAGQMLLTSIILN